MENILISFEKWLLLTRGEIKLIVGDTYTTFEISEVAVTKKVDGFKTTHYEHTIVQTVNKISNEAYLRLHNRFLQRDKNAYFKDKFVELSIDSFLQLIKK